MKRSTLLALPAVALIAAGTLLPALPAAASTSTDGCNTSLTLPSIVRINYINMVEDVRLASDCTIGVMSYSIVRSDGMLSQSELWDSSSSYPYYWYLSNPLGPGRYQATNGSAQDVNGNVIEAPDSNVSVAKYDSNLRWRGSRAGGYVTLREDLTRYSYSGGRYYDSGGGYVSWSSAVVHFQRLSGGRWYTVRTVRSNGHGVASVRIRAGRATWRALVDDSSATWGGAGGKHRI